MYYKFTYYLQSTIGWSCKQHQLDAKTSHWLEARQLLHDLWLLPTRDKNSKYLYGRDFLAERAYPLWDIRTRVSPLSDVTGILPLYEGFPHCMRDSPSVWVRVTALRVAAVLHWLERLLSELTFSLYLLLGLNWLKRPLSQPFLQGFQILMAIRVLR